MPPVDDCDSTPEGLLVDGDVMTLAADVVGTLIAVDVEDDADVEEEVEEEVEEVGLLV